MKKSRVVPAHIAIIPNGNRRDSQRTGVSLAKTYQRGAERALEVARWAHGGGVRHVTFFGLSCENILRRPKWQINALMKGAIYFFDAIEAEGWHLHPFGNLEEFEGVERYSPLYERLAPWRNREQSEGKFVVHAAINYSGLPQHELAPLLEMIYRIGEDEVRRKDPTLMNRLLSAGVPPVDLMIRTGGEHRISGFLPFQSAYAELFFTDVLWGDFTQEMFQEALQWYAQQERNFGK